MTSEGAIELIVNALLCWGKIAGPLLVAALVVGVVIGILQAATQVNEASVSFLTKLIAMGLTVLALGSWTMRTLVEYTGRTIGSIADVVK
ncbi:MAG TPA: flagellar biosynthetic protein FliQ [Polyangiaceae bacterium]|jgi:flagellar biosynthetic protein FliQ|nr:flagellar biosynthetic protein FliQ [Polyangiaceae bacterium]